MALRRSDKFSISIIVVEWEYQNNQVERVREPLIHQNVVSKISFFTPINVSRHIPPFICLQMEKFSSYDISLINIYAGRYKVSHHVLALLDLR